MVAPRKYHPTCGALPACYAPVHLCCTSACAAHAWGMQSLWTKWKVFRERGPNIAYDSNTQSHIDTRQGRGSTACSAALLCVLNILVSYMCMSQLA